jgi:hypothetical protein
VNVNAIPAHLDELLRLDASATRTANTNGTARNLGGTNGGSGKPMNFIVRYSAADRADTNEAYTFTVQESVDGTTYTTITVGVAVTGAAGTVAIPAVISGPFCRVVLTVAGTTPSITYETFISPGGFV